MPVYDYECGNCGAKRLDLYLAHRDTPVYCRECESVWGYPKVMTRVFPAPAFHVHGFSSKNGYAGGQTYEVKQKDPHVKVTVTS